MPRNRRQTKGKNPALVAAVLAPTVGQLIKESKRSTVAQSPSRALVPYKPPLLTSTRQEQKAILRGADATLAVAPTATAFMLSGPNWTFSAAPVRNGQTGVRLSGKQLWATVQSDAGGAGSAGKPINTYGGAQTAALTFDPDDVKTMPPPMTSLAQIFQRYCLRRCDVLYTPAVGTSLNVGVAAMVISDAALSQAQTANTVDWSQTIMEYSNSVMGPVWQAFRLRVPCDETLRYTYQSVADASLSAAEERQDHAFGLGMSFTQTPGSGVKYGFLHLDYVIDFYEVVSQMNELSLLRAERRFKFFQERRRLAGLESKSEEKKEKVLDVIVVDETQHTPPPSARGTLGLADYVTLKRGVARASSAKA